jgi:hypothetical protein
MANEESADEFDQAGAAVAEDSGKGLTNALVFMTTVCILVAIIMTIKAMDKWFDRGMFA